jgi:hypothetical protein
VPRNHSGKGVIFLSAEGGLIRLRDGTLQMMVQLAKAGKLRSRLQ